MGRVGCVATGLRRRRPVRPVFGWAWTPQMDLHRSVAYGDSDKQRRPIDHMLPVAKDHSIHVHTVCWRARGGSPSEDFGTLCLPNEDFGRQEQNNERAFSNKRGRVELLLYIVATKKLRDFTTTDASMIWVLTLGKISNRQWCVRILGRLSWMHPRYQCLCTRG